ncbi:hypothetical protein P43SY_005549 [Pythium insidiosum]|uniref:OTU domain-containing protein n=1 Tax=Pythium insidiosum TaxID=114742 RepID=A0AAD5LNY4_PYTIN|nr:hypothetical protein P43SY_005549 [Pythium insidiosum]
MADDERGGKAETPGQMKQRHKLELRNLQNEIKAFQKKAKKDKLSKKESEEQIRKMEEDMKQRHAEELAALEGEGERDTAALAAVEATDAQPEAPSKPQGPTKAQRRRENKKQKERERQERIEEENKHVVSDRQIETDIILAKLRPLKLDIKDIPSDGHCMYHAVADQMKRHGMQLTAQS